MSTFIDLFSKHAGRAFAHQLALADYIENRNWNLDLKLGTVSFGEEMKYPIQLLGSEALGNNQTWMWAWANDVISPAPNAMKLVQQLKEYGEQKKVPELYEASFSLDRVSSHELAMVASGISGNACYYRGPYEGGAVFFVIENLPKQLFAPVPPERAIRVLTEVISAFEANHRLLAESFLESQGYELTQGNSNLEAKRGAANVLISFDQQDFIADISGTIPARKKWWQFWK